jgi:uncharacterized RDD family membrane protein YckC
MFGIFGDLNKNEAVSLLTGVVMVLIGLLGIAASYLMVIWTRDKQTLADWIAGTLVVKPRTSEAERQATAIKIVR